MLVLCTHTEGSHNNQSNCYYLSFYHFLLSHAGFATLVLTCYVLLYIDHRDIQLGLMGLVFISNVYYLLAQYCLGHLVEVLKKEGNR